MFDKYGALKDIATTMSVIGGVLFMVSLVLGVIILINAGNAGANFLLVIAGAALIQDLLLMAFSLLVMGVGGAIKVVMDIEKHTEALKDSGPRAA